MSHVISSIDDANLDVASWGCWEVTKLVGIGGIGLDHGDTVRRVFLEATTIRGGRHVASATEERKGMDLGIELDAFNVGILLDGIPIATGHFEGRYLQLGGKVLDLAFLGDLLQVFLALNTSRNVERFKIPKRSKSREGCAQARDMGWYSGS